MKFETLLEQVRAAIEIAVPAMALVNSLADKVAQARDVLTEDQLSALDDQFAKVMIETKAVAAATDAALRRAGG